MFLQKRFISYAKNFNYFKSNTKIINDVINKNGNINKNENINKNIHCNIYENNIKYYTNNISNLTYLSLNNIEEKKDLIKLNAYLNYHEKYDNYISIKNQNLLKFLENIHIFKKSKILTLNNTNIKYYKLFDKILEKNIKITSITIDDTQLELLNKSKKLIQNISNITFINILKPIKIENNNLYKINYIYYINKINSLDTILNYVNIIKNNNIELDKIYCNNSIKYKHLWKYYIYDITEKNLYILCEFLYNIKYLQYNDEQYNFIIYLKKFDNQKFSKYLNFLEEIKK